MTSTARYDSPLGPLALIFDGEALIGLRFGAPDCECVSLLSSCSRWLDRYFSGCEPDGFPPVKLVGTAFQQRVWQALMEIPYGQTTTYSALARRVDCRSAQAVGQAVGRNPIAIIVPCHRVVGSDGSLTGYAYGLERKAKLLQMENSHRLAVTG